VIFPGPEAWARIDDWIDVAATRGERFGFADLLIASLAADGGHEVWSLDDDLRRMAKVGLVKRHDPAAWKPG
jgi:predicted nucleic acid-binding protein